MKRRIYILIFLVILLVLAVGGCRKAGTWLVKEDIPRQADVMVMLTGRIADRVLKVADLYKDQVAAKVWIVREDMGADRELEKRGVELIRESTRARNALVVLGIPPENILILPGDASSTQMEAQIIRDFLQTQNGVGSVLLVTSSSHTRRAYQIFKAAFRSMENEPELFCSPSSYSGFNSGNWWKSREDIQEVVFEYLKMANFFLFEKRKLRIQE
ncbi:MAG: YdcF family protein [Bacteroidales bacterium]|nr:YdcF family protein [Bacteroidales bacterium]